jgi:hypothetical protein
VDWKINNSPAGVTLTGLKFVEPYKQRGDNMLRRSNKHTDRVAGQLAAARQGVNNTVGPRPMWARQVPTTTKIEYLLEHCGTKVILTDHARTQARNRHDMPIEQMTNYFRQIVEGLIDFDWKYDDQEIFVFSHKYRRGVILTGRRDFKSASRDRVYVIMTMYPFGKAQPMKDSTEIVYV